MSEIELKKSGYPNFASVSEEDLLGQGTRRIEARALAAFKNGTVRRRSSVQLDPRDAQQAQILVAQRGVEYQEFVRGLVHQALERELSAAK